MPTTILLPCALLVINPCALAWHSLGTNHHSTAVSPYFLSQRTAVNKINLEETAIPTFLNHKFCTSLNYDAGTLRDSVASNSVLKSSLAKPDLLNEHHANFDRGNSFNPALKQKNMYDYKFEFNDKRPPRDVETVSFYAVMKGQCSPKNPDIQEKIEPGDIYAAKYYPGRNIYAGQGYIFNLEARIKLPWPAERLFGLLQLIAFVDTRAIAMNQYILADGLNHTTINTAGAGVNWTYADDFELKVYFANKLDNEVLAIPPSTSHLFWIQAVKYY